MSQRISRNKKGNEEFWVYQNKNTMYDLWDATKAVLRSKFIALNTDKRRRMWDFSFHLEILGQEEQI